MIYIYIRDRDLCASLEQYLELVHPHNPYFWWRNRDEICLYFQNNIGFMGVPGRQPLQKIGQRGGITAKNESSLRCVIRYPLFFGWLELVLRRLRRPECPAGPVLVNRSILLTMKTIWHLGEGLGLFFSLTVSQFPFFVDKCNTTFISSITLVDKYARSVTTTRCGPSSSCVFYQC